LLLKKYEKGFNINEFDKRLKNFDLYLKYAADQTPAIILGNLRFVCARVLVKPRLAMTVNHF
jgi:hypothetical protein